jgi:hypothetical protein
MESTLNKPAFVAGNAIPKATTILFWTFTAYYELLPQGAQAFTRLGFPNGYFRWELSLAKLVGVAVLVVPMVPSRGFFYMIKEWAYAGFAINLVSAIIAHLSISDRPLAFLPSTLTSVLWAASYFFWRRLQASRANQSRD